MLLTCFLLLLLTYSLISRRLEKTWVTGPMLFTLGGLALSRWMVGPAQHLETYLHLAEVGLVLLLFTDASRTGLRSLWTISAVPARLLSLGMLLTLTLGTLIGRWLMPQLSWWEAGILSAVLAPTDAGLGLIVVNSPKVPSIVRQSLNVEAGLNDGLSVPFMLFFMALAAPGDHQVGLLTLVWQQLGLGALVGLTVGSLGGWLIERSRRADWIAPSSLGTAVMGLPLLCLLACEPLGASAFIASFVAGLASSATFPQVGQHSVEFSEEWGQILNSLIFFLFGLLALGSLGDISPGVALYALLSLTLVRMLPVALALLGTGFAASSVLFMGWFGPRGLASVVLGMVYMEEHLRLAGEPAMRACVLLTVAGSILAHGLTAAPLIEVYSRAVARLPQESPELKAEPDPAS